MASEKDPAEISDPEQIGSHSSEVWSIWLTVTPSASWNVKTIWEDVTERASLF